MIAYNSTEEIGENNSTEEIGEKRFYVTLVYLDKI
jgi:hypothetical protein